MIKVFSQYTPRHLLLLVLSENLLILLSIWAVAAFRTGDFHLSMLALPAVFGKVLAMTLICQLCLHFSDLYDLSSAASGQVIFLRLLQALGLACLLLAALYFLLPHMRFGSGLAEMAVLTIIFVVLLWRVALEWAQRAWGEGERILLVGAGPGTQELVRQVQNRPDLRLRLIGLVAEDGMVGGAMGSLPCLGELGELRQIVAEHRPHRVVVGLAERRRRMPVKELLAVRSLGVPVEETSSLYEKVAGRLPVENLRPSELIFSDGFRKSWALRFYKRAFGFCSAVLGLLLASPLIALVVVAVKLESRGPILYRQERVGLNGRVFQVLKFRSMRADAEAMSGPVWARERDPRVTRVGRVIRALRLDELPQLWNVLRGEMTFVGPRPERPVFVAELSNEIPYYDLRHSVRPGITGWAQVSYRYGSSREDAKTKLEFDLFYIKNLSITMDLFIMFQTVKIIILGRGAR